MLKNKYIYIRTNFNESIGFGHIYRCIRLARKLKKNFQVIFYIDRKNLNILKSFEVIEIYNRGKFKNQINDASNFISLTKKNGPGIVILDDYRFDYSWQKKISKYHEKLITFDDTETLRHYADTVVNYNPKNYIYSKFKKKNNKKPNSSYLVHPNYSIFEKKIHKDNYQFKKKYFYITFYLGGTGDINYFLKIINNLLKNKKIFIIIILSKYTVNTKLFYNLKNKFENFKIVKNFKNLNYYIKNTNLYITSAGTAIFESAFFNTPTLLIKLNKKQNTNIFALEKLGHYFFLKISEFKNSEKILLLINLIKKNIVQYLNLIKKKEIEIDGHGIDRIINHINTKNDNYKINNLNPKTNNKDMKKYHIKKVYLSDINKYLYFRNKKANLIHNANPKKINILDHYIWWFSNKRNSFKLIKNDKTLLYFYDDKLIINKKNYLITGFFICKKCTIQDVLYALNYQRRMYDNVIWLQFIKKENKTMNMLSKYLGWKLIKFETSILSFIQKKYDINMSQYYFYIRDN